MMDRTEKIRKIVHWTGWAAAAALVLVMVIFLARYGRDLVDVFLSEDPPAAMKAFLGELGGWGALALVLLQTLQIAVAFLPGEPVELASGMLFGGFWGSVLCLIGVLLGSILVYFGVSRLGEGMITAFHDSEKLQRFRQLRAFQNARNAEWLTFFLFLVPGIPKDFLTFVAPLTPMKPWRFLLISTLGRAPGMFITTYAGYHFLAGTWQMSVLLYGILLAGAAVGLLLYRKWLR